MKIGYRNDSSVSKRRSLMTILNKEHTLHLENPSV